MTRIHFMAVFATATSLLLFSCKEKTKKAEDGVTSVSSSSVTIDATIPVKPETFLLITHKVANYPKWLPVYESHDSVRTASGLSNNEIGRGIGADSNMVFISLKMADAEKAKGFSTSQDAKEKMMKAGVVGPPKFDFVEIVSIDHSTDASTTRVLMTHQVKDWDLWKKEYDSHRQIRIGAGMIDRSVGHSIGDNHMVFIECAVMDIPKAKAFLASKELKEKMATAGVEGPQSAFFYQVVKKY